jgi:16S rRNA processing protein RimM
MKQDECFQLGYVVKPHGIHGDLTILLDVDNPEEYSKLESVFIEFDKNLVPFFIESISLRGNKARVHFTGVDSIDEARDLQSCQLFLPLDQLPDLGSDQFYYHDIIGYKVVDMQIGQLGKIKNVYSRAGQDLLSMKYRGKEVLIPITDEVVKAADHHSKILKVDLPDGLLDIYLK